MARPRIVRTKEEASAIPPNQPIQVELNMDQSVEVPVPPKVDASGDGSKPPPPPPAPPVAPPAPPEREDITSLKAQLARLAKEKEEQAAYIAEMNRRAEEQRAYYQRQQVDWQTANTAASQAQLDSINTGIAALNNEIESVRHAKSVAFQSQDYVSVAELDDRMITARVKLADLERSKERLEERAKAPPPHQQQPYYNQDPVELAIQAWRLGPSEQVWLKKHPEIASSDRLARKLGVAYEDAMAKGLYRGSPEYLQFLDQAMGYIETPKIEQQQQEEEDDQPEPPPQNISAPVSREAVSASTGRPTTTRITLTAAQREAARDAGVDEVTYARGLMELDRRKKSGMYTDGGGTG